MQPTSRNVSDFMTDDVYSLPPDMLIVDAVPRLTNRKFSGAPVVDGNGLLLGMVSEVDMIRSLAAVEQGDVTKGTISDLMTELTVNLRPSSTVWEAASLFSHFPYRRFPVTEDGKVVGLVARRDVLERLYRLAIECDNLQRDHRTFVA